MNVAGDEVNRFVELQIFDLKHAHADPAMLGCAGAGTKAQKRADFELFKQVEDLMNRKEHLTKEGLQQIVNIRASMNNGLPDDLKAAFPNTIPVPRPIVELKGIPDPNWVAGFASGEGSFFVGIKKATTHKSGVQVLLKFQTNSAFTRC